MRKKVLPLLFLLMFLVTSLAPVSAQEERTYTIEITIDISESIQFEYLVVIPGPDQADNARNNFALGTITQDEVENTILGRIEEGVNASLTDVEFEVKNMDNWGADLVYEFSCNAENDIRSSGKFTYLLLVPSWENTTVRINLPSRVISAEPQVESVNINIEENSVDYGFSEPGFHALEVTFGEVPVPAAEGIPVLYVALAIAAVVGLGTAAYFWRRRKLAVSRMVEKSKFGS